MNENRGEGTSPYWGSILSKSRLRLFTLGGVPVLKRRSLKPISVRHDERKFALSIPEGPDSVT